MGLSLARYCAYVCCCPPVVLKPHRLPLAEVVGVDAVLELDNTEVRDEVEYFLARD